MKRMAFRAYCEICKQGGVFAKDAPKEWLENPTCPNGHPVKLVAVGKVKL